MTLVHPCCTSLALVIHDKRHTPKSNLPQNARARAFLVVLPTHLRPSHNVTNLHDMRGVGVCLAWFLRRISRHSPTCATHDRHGFQFFSPCGDRKWRCAAQFFVLGPELGLSWSGGEENWRCVRHRFGIWEGKLAIDFGIVGCRGHSIQDIGGSRGSGVIRQGTCLLASTIGMV